MDDREEDAAPAYLMAEAACQNDLLILDASIDSRFGYGCHSGWPGWLPDYRSESCIVHNRGN